MKSESIFIPIGIDCYAAFYLRKNNLRIQAFPFDWNIISVNSAINLIKNGFKDFLNKENLVFLTPENRKLFREKDTFLKVSDDIITPVLDIKYQILFPHDFSERGKYDLLSVKKKYERRITRLQNLLNESSSKIIFIYNLSQLNDWQLEQYQLCQTTFPRDTVKDIEENFISLKETVNNDIKITSLSSLQLQLEKTPRIIRKIQNLFPKNRKN